MRCHGLILAGFLTAAGASAQPCRFVHPVPGTPDGFLWQAESLVGEGFLLQLVCREDTWRVRLLRGEADDVREPLPAAVADLPLPSPRRGERILFGLHGTCGHPHQPDPRIVALVRAAETPVLADVRRAWRARTRAPYGFEEVPVTGLVCRNEEYGMATAHRPASSP